MWGETRAGVQKGPSTPFSYTTSTTTNSGLLVSTLLPHLRNIFKVIPTVLVTITELEPIAPLKEFFSGQILIKLKL